ncbi:hypothetical protein L7F22_013693 [Adiantum nelumboides]|nr:hypothetical protein [Adiantum nelumboides]
MELSQMCVQAIWEKDSPLKQVPHFSNDVIKRCKDRGIEDVFSLGDVLPDLSESERNELLQMDKKQLADVAKFTNDFPYIEVSFDILEVENLSGGNPIIMNVSLEKDDEDEEEEQNKDPTVLLLSTLPRVVQLVVSRR